MTTNSQTQKVAPQLLEILVCPLCGHKLEYDFKNQELICWDSLLAYQIKDGIPIMLIDEARKIENQSQK